jgi:hypothetical protein
MGDDGSDQLISFFAYSLFIYPATNWLVSPQRGFPKWRAALHAGLFLLLVSSFHMMYENHEKGPNHYQLMQVTRSSTVGSIKKAYRNLSLELHPDKNRSPTASDDFNRVKQAFDVLVDKEKRREYDRLGDQGVRTMKNTVIDHRYILIQMIVYYCSSMIFAFIMTFSEASGDALSQSLFGLATMLLIESLLVLQEAPILPSWFLPTHTAGDLVSNMHRLFPAYMNGCRCILGVFHVDRKDQRVVVLDKLAEIQNEWARESQILIRSTPVFANHSADDDQEVEDGEEVVPGSEFTMSRALNAARNRYASSKEGKNGSIASYMQDTAKVIKDPKSLSRKNSSKEGAFNLSPEMIWLRNIVIYLAARFIFVKNK